VDELTRLAHAARLGDGRALDTLVRSSYADVQRLCATLVDDSSAEDLAQETLLRATRALPRFRGDASARTWILAIARRVCVDELRARYRRDRRDRRLALATEQSLAPEPDREVMLRELLLQLDFDQRMAFVLTQLLRCSYEQAADICDCPVGTIRSRVARARERLVLALGEPARSESRRGQGGGPERMA
jgi:RNA polymerase sigma-70 factor, ECF subfamily